MIKRESNHIIVQHRPGDPSYLDGGDSARAVGLMAMSGSKLDQNLLPLFINSDDLGVRHPYQYPHYNPNSFTRDQLLCLLGGFSSLDNVDPIKHHSRGLFWSHAKRLFFCQNTHDQEGNKKPWYSSRDPLHFGHIMVFAKAMGVNWFYQLVRPLGIVFLWLEYFFSVYIKPYRESNQTLAIFSSAGDFWLRKYCHNHPDWKKPITEYWSGWRDQKEIGEALIKYVEGRIK